MPCFKSSLFNRYLFIRSMFVFWITTNTILFFLNCQVKEITQSNTFVTSKGYLKNTFFFLNNLCFTRINRSCGKIFPVSFTNRKLLHYIFRQDSGHIFHCSLPIRWYHKNNHFFFSKNHPIAISKNEYMILKLNIPSTCAASRRL